MRILYLTQYFNFPDEAGSSRHYQFARAWAEHGHEVTVLTGNVNYKTGDAMENDRFRTYSKRKHEDGFELYRLWVYRHFKGSFKKRLLFFGSYAAHASLIGSVRKRPDVVFASSTPLSIGVPGYVLARRFRVPFVFELRDLWPEAAVAAGVMKDPKWVSRTQSLAQFLYRKADHLVAVTEGIQEGILGHGVPEDKLDLVRNGVDHWMDPDAFADQNPLARFREGRGDRIICLYVGAHGIWNDLSTLVEGARALKDDPRFVFVFVGDGDDRPRLEAQARDYGLDNVHFLGALPKKDAFAAICHSDIALIAASGHEHNRQTLPNKIFDYMAARVPVVVAAGEGEMDRMLKVSEGGWRTPAENGPALAEKLREVAALSAEERNRVGNKGRDFVLEHYYRPRQAETLLRVFGGLTGKDTGIQETSESGSESVEPPIAPERAKEHV